MTDYDVAIIGAGPYGLSIAAHVKRRNRDVGVFGVPMHSWDAHMPAGMMLKSEGWASSLSDPHDTFTLKRFCHENGHAYQDFGLPVRLDVFVAYGRSFQARFVPDLRQDRIRSVARNGETFALTRQDGGRITARRVVIASGILPYAYIPAPLDTLPEAFVTHSSQDLPLARLAGQRVAVVGGGSSAVDTAVMLKRAGAEPHLVSRRSRILFNSRVKTPRPLLDCIRSPMSGIGESWLSRFCTDAPRAFRTMPEAVRLRLAKNHLGPAAGWFVKDEAEGGVAFHLGRDVIDAKVSGNRLRATLRNRSGEVETLVVDHLIAATGFQVDVAKLCFLDAHLRNEIRLTGRAPWLSPSFESSVPGLCFAGVTSANTFGPMLRFVFGARYAARRLARHLAH